jgi:DNA-binding response OmpR family regulator
MKVLVADPNPLIREIITQAIQPTGWPLECVEDGSAALAFLNECKGPCIAFLSTELSAPSAHSLAQRYINRPPDSVIVPLVVTLSCDSRATVDALMAGAVDVLVFPMDREVIRAKADAAHRYVRRLEGAAATGGAPQEVVHEPTPPNVRTTLSTINDKLRKVQTLVNSTPLMIEAISGLGIEPVVEVEKHVFADKEPTFAMWCTIVAPQASIWVDVLVESDRKSSMLLFQKLTGMPAESGRDALDTVGEVVNIVQGAIKSGLQGEGHEVMTPVVPKAVPTANLPKLNEHMVDRIRVSLNADGILLAVSLYISNRPVIRKTIESLQANDVTVESLPMTPGVDLKLLNRGVLLDERGILKLREKLTGDSRRLALNVMEAPSLIDLLRGA